MHTLQGSWWRLRRQAVSCVLVVGVKAANGIVLGWVGQWSTIHHLTNQNSSLPLNDHRLHLR